jgi:group I intron endonuclease
MDTAYIYKITNPRNKIYIGSTNDYQKRFKTYKRLACKAQLKLYSSFLKYGFDAHKMELIQKCDRVDRYRLEAYYGCLYNSLSKNGLNILLPKSEFYSAMSKEDKEKRSKSRIGIKFSESHLENMRKAQLGKKQTKEHIENMKKAITGLKRTEETKKKMSIARGGLYLNTQTGIYYKGAKEAAYYACVSVSHFTKMINGERKNKTNIIKAF